MPVDYGRAGAKKSQKGRNGSRYRAFSPVDVEERLTGSELDEYRSALSTLGTPAQLVGGGAIRGDYLQKQREAMDNAYRLRELAASRAFGDFSAAAMQHSKPWLVQRPTGGLIAEQTVPYGLARNPAAALSFAGEGVRGATFSPTQMMGEHRFGRIGYEEAARAKRRRKAPSLLSGQPTAPQQPTPSQTLLPQVDLGYLSFGGF